jgi:dihydrofolate reductase
VRSLAEINPENDARDYFVIGGAQLFQEALPLCSDLYLTLVKHEAVGDVFLGPFEDRFNLRETIHDTPEFSILHYVQYVAD